MKHYLALSALAVCVTFSGCAKNTPPGAQQESAIATVNGKPVDRTAFDIYLAAIARKPVNELSAEERNQALDQFIMTQLAADRAIQNGMDKTQEVSARLSLARMNVLSEAVLKKYVDEHPITDAEIRAEYDTQVAAMGRQYHIRNILVESKAVAEGVIAKLKNGADFAAVAKKESTDPAAQKGGDMDWIPLGAMMPEFAKAVTALDKGQFTTTPVQTQYGWHVIKLEDYRTPEPPAFDTVKDRVKSLVQRKKLQAYLEELRKNAKIEKKEAAPSPATTATPEPGAK